MRVQSLRHLSFHHPRTPRRVHQIRRETSGPRGTRHLSIKHSNTQRRVHAIEEKQAGTAIVDASESKRSRTQHRVPERRRENGRETSGHSRT